MSMTFSMRGATGERYHGAHSRTKLEIRGTWNLAGPQPVDDDGGVPECVAEIFRNNPGIAKVALCGDDRGVVYSRMREPEAE